MTGLSPYASQQRDAVSSRESKQGLQGDSSVIFAFVSLPSEGVYHNVYQPLAYLADFYTYCMVGLDSRPLDPCNCSELEVSEALTDCCKKLESQNYDKNKLACNYGSIEDSAFEHLSRDWESPSLTISNEEGSSEENPEYRKWRLADRFVTSLINSSLTEEAMSETMGTSTSRELWTALEESFSSKSTTRELHLSDELQSLKQGSYSISDHAK
ncbi:hypothetical protein GIB67_013517 [Kingdonia uniflora]|uniref:Uncharacterized protein n=1 Tax=Kingdonia uniflora TaxID=39325 RepID=A0A7J7KUU0_9MAGN|nr:hypothetical protein GIB67_013517 [Kingdonia uniflora]